MPKKSFTVGGSPNDEAIEFELEGRDRKGNPIQPITFLCVPQMQGTHIVEIYQDDAMAAGRAAMEIIPKAVVPEQRAFYEEIIHGDEIIVELDTLGEIAKYLIEVYSKNPTSGPPGSTAGLQPTGPTSMADYLSAPEPTLQPSPPIVSSTPPMP